MTRQGWAQLAILSVKDPAQAARDILGFQLERNVLWLAFSLAVVLNSFAQILSNQLIQHLAGIAPMIDMPPMGYVGFFAGMLLIFVTALAFIGPKMGGTGKFNDVFVLIIWIQYLRFALQIATLALMLIAPQLGALVAIAGAFVGLYILAHFVDQAHRLNSIGQAVFVVLLSVLAMAVVLIFFLSLAGGPIAGNPTYV